MRWAWRAHLLAAFPLLWLAVFFLAPLGFAVVYSFGDAGFGGVTLGFTLANYHAALSGLYLAVFLHTLGFALGAWLSITKIQPVVGDAAPVLVEIVVAFA